MNKFMPVMGSALEKMLGKCYAIRFPPLAINMRNFIIIIMTFFFVARRRHFIRDPSETEVYGIASHNNIVSGRMENNVCTTPAKRAREICM